MTSLTTDLIKTFLFRFLLILCLFLSSFLLTYSTSLAQQAGTSITPASFDKLMDPGTEEQNGITIQNMSDVEQKYYLFVKNISGVKDGEYLFLPNPMMRKPVTNSLTGLVYQ